MLSRNILTVLAIALSVSALPWNTPYYPSPTSGGITTIAPTSTPTSNIPNRTGAGGGGRDGLASTSPAGVHPTGIVSSGNDGEGNQDVGNNGQNAINGAANSGTVNGDVTVEQATTTCGNAQLNCCNKVSKKGDTTNAGLLGALFGSGDLGVQCTPINLPIIGIQIPINKACDAKAACCQGNTVQNGLVNVGCIALASLL